MNDLVTTKDFKELAIELFKATIKPGGFKNTEDCLYALMMGSEMGLKPIYSLNNIVVINGKASLNADALLAVVKNCPDYYGIEFTEETNEACTCVLKRKYPSGVIDTRTVRFTYEDAKTAGLADKDVWRKYRKRLLKARAQTFACRDLFSDVLAGIYTEDEIDNIPLNDNDVPASSHPIHTEFEFVEEYQNTEQGKLAIANALKGLDEYKGSPISDKQTIAIETAKDEATLIDLIDKFKAEIDKDKQPPAPPDNSAEIAELQAKCEAGIAKLATTQYRNYHIEKHQKNSNKKYLDTNTIKSCEDVEKLKAYYNHLLAEYWASVCEERAKTAGIPEDDAMYVSIKKYNEADDAESLKQLAKELEETIKKQKLQSDVPFGD